MSDLESIHVPDQFQFLIVDFQFQVIKYHYSYMHFGNWYIDLTNGSLNVRILLDRSILTAEVSPPFAPDRWLPLEHITKLVLRRDPVDDVTLAEQAEFLRSHLVTVTELVSAKNLDNTVAQIRQIGLERFKKLFPGSVRDT